jgi:hypothetical protein
MADFSSDLVSNAILIEELSVGSGNHSLSHKKRPQGFVQLRQIIERHARVVMVLKAVDRP